MDSLISLAVIIVLLIVIAPIIAFVALSRSGANRDNIFRLTQRVHQLEQQIKQLGSVPTSEAPATHALVRQEQAAVEPAFVEPIADELIVDEPIVYKSIEQNDLQPLSSSEITLNYQPENVSVARSEKFEKKQPDSSPWQTHSEVQEKQELPGVISSMIGWLIKGNPLAKVGILLLFFGLVYLMKYSIERDMFPIELRLASSALISLGLLGVGWWLRHKQSTYALILQGGAIGAFYLTVFGAFRIYELIPHILAFGLMLAICAASVSLAVLQRALSLAMLASIGGYLSPILLSTGGGSHVGLFSYYLLLSVGILAISIWQPWRILNLLGFAFTFGVAAIWGFEYYQPKFYLSCQLFLIVNILIFGVLSVGLSLRQQIKGKEIIDGVLLFGPPLLGFGMQYAITEQWEFGPAFSALGFGVVYLMLALGGLRRYPGLGIRIASSGLALGLAFITLAIPLALSAEWTAIAWSLEGLGIVWVGLNQQQRKMSWSGSAILVLALCSLIASFDSFYRVGYAFTMITAIVMLCYLAAAMLWHKHRPENSFWRPISRVFTVVGVLLWLVWIFLLSDLILYDLIRYGLPLPIFITLPVGMMCLSSLLWHTAGKRLNWPGIMTASWLLWPFMLIVSLGYYSSINSYYPIDQYVQQLGSWLAAAATGYWLLKHQAGQLKKPIVEKGFHLFLYWGLIIAFHSLAVVLAERANINWWGMNEWIIGALNAFIAVMILVTARIVRLKNYWFVSHRPLYLSVGLAPVAALLLFYTIVLNTMDGVSVGWGYIPLINPLDLSVAFALLTLFYWVNFDHPYRHQIKQFCYVALALLCFYWLNGIILRTLAYYDGISWNSYSLWSSRLVQTTLALFWTFIALVCMICSNKYHHRKTWLLGAALLGVTIIKLFVVDAAKGGGLARAIAFIGVALLILVVGYFAPLPPKEKRNTDREPKNEETNEN